MPAGLVVAFETVHELGALLRRRPDEGREEGLLLLGVVTLVRKVDDDLEEVVHVGAGHGLSMLDALRHRGEDMEEMLDDLVLFTQDFRRFGHEGCQPAEPQEECPEHVRMAAGRKLKAAADIEADA